MYPLTLTATIHNAEQLAAFSAAMSGAGQPTASAAKQTTKAESPKSEAKADTKSTPSTGTTKESTASAAPSATGASSGETGGKVYTIDDAKALTTGAVKAGKRAEIVALLEKHGVKVAATLPAEDVQAFCEAAAELQA